uniref:MYND-type domain-containing protein n=1 Tax=Anopheles coluzzii TaxID=1518534 RepID=A0A8W7P0B2_ANOCL
MASYPCAVFPEEIEPFVQSIRPYQVADIGSKGWIEQHEVLQKLCQQAFIEATTKQEEVVKEQLILEDKIPLLVHELYSVLCYTPSRGCAATREGVFEKYRSGSWMPAHGDAILKVTETEAQTWFCLYRLLFNGDLMRDYEINGYRHREIGKCIGLMNEQLLDQLPALIPLKQHLCTLQLTNEAGGGTGGSTASLLLEELPEVRERLMQAARRTGWDQIVEKQRKIFIDLEEHDVVEMAKRIGAAYNTDLLERYTEQEEKRRKQGENDASAVKVCGNCGASAAKKCSNCMHVYYCSRDCQLQNWTDHKELCRQLK